MTGDRCRRLRRVDGPYVDCHVHFFDGAQLRYPWVEADSFPALGERFAPADLLAATSDPPAAVVHVQAEADHSDPVAETRWLAAERDLASAHGLPTGIVAYADLAADDLDAVLDAHQSAGPVVGIRQEVWWEAVPSRPDIGAVDLLAQPAWQRGLRAVARRDLSFDVTCFDHQLDDVADVLATAEVTAVIDHFGLPDLADAAAFARWRAAVGRLARLEHVVMKVSGIVQLQEWDPDWSVDRIRPAAHEVLEAFGTGRCILGSNFPIDGMGGAAYDDVWAGLAALVADLSPEERRALRHDNARRVYRLDVA